jgi:chromosome segregation ATPase
MRNLIKKYSGAPIAFNKQTAGASENDKAAIKKIEWLEGELNQKTDELNQICKVQHTMSIRAKNCAASLHAIQNQLQSVVGHLDRSNKQIAALTQENIALKSSGDEWFRRTIKLEFEVLTAKDELKKIEDERDLAIKTIEFLQSELMLTDKENSRGRNQLYPE